MMRPSNELAGRSPVATLRVVAVMTLVVLVATLASSATSRASSHTVGLGTATDFAILAGSAITFANPAVTTVTGDIGIHPGIATDVTGYDDINHTGTAHFGDAVAEQAKQDLVAAYNDAAGRAVTSTVGPDLAGQDLGPGVYQSTGAGAFQVGGGGTLTLSGSANDVWIFKSSSTLNFSDNSQVVLSGGADACNVFWQVGSSATHETGSKAVGTIMALTSITLKTSAEVDGRVLARNGAVTSDSNTITRPTCTTVAVASSSDGGGSGQALRLVKFFFDADGNRVGAPAGDWAVTAAVGEDVRIALNEQSTSGWANISNNYTVAETSLEGWAEVGCDDFTLPDIGTEYRDVSGTGDFTMDQDEAAHAVCNQAGGAVGGTTVEIPTRVDTGGGGTATPTGQQGVLLLAGVAGAGVYVARRRRVTNDV